MKKILILIVIYLAFISLGLPDSILGAGWPSMFKELGVPAHYAGIVFMIIAAGTVTSSLVSAKLIRRFGVAQITSFSVALTAIALLGFSISEHFIYLCLLAVPLGLGAGCVDAALNNYVALHYHAKHMNWLHCFWGIGASIGPIIMGTYLASGNTWHMGYQTIGLIQVGLVFLLLLSIPFWIRNQKVDSDEERTTSISYSNLIKVPGLKDALITFFCYCTIEATFGLWGASYLVFERNYQTDEAAKLVSLYYGGITLGRFGAGFITNMLSNKQLVYFGQGIILIGVTLIILPYEFTLVAGYLVIGLGCAPIFPALLHETPRNFGKEKSQTVMGVEMASAYIGMTLMPMLFGKISSELNFSYLPIFIIIILTVMLYFNRRLNNKVHKYHV